MSALEPVRCGPRVAFGLAQDPLLVSVQEISAERAGNVCGLSITQLEVAFVHRVIYDFGR